MWAHLQPKTAKEFLGNAYLNRLRLNDWRAIFNEAWPGCTVRTEASSRIGTEVAAQGRLEQGVITGYTLEELVTHTVLAFWQKPSPHHSFN
jgi:hypothetical protein